MYVVSRPVSLTRTRDEPNREDKEEDFFKARLCYSISTK